MDEVNNDYIDKALNELIPVFGTKEFIDHKEIINLIDSGKIKEAIKAIASYLGLPTEVNISYVPKGYRPSASDGFQSTQLVKTDWRGQANSSITAQVSIPQNLPLYGTDRMVNFPINVRLSENCAENPATLISVMAHELSHIVLYSMWHKEKENEFYTDLTAMVLGFANIIKKGRKIIKQNTFTSSGFLSTTTTTQTQTTTYGYLSDNNFDFAFKKIVKILSKQQSERKKLLEKLSQSERQLNKIKKLPLCFSRYLEYLDKNFNQKISQEDAYRISAFHQTGYTDNFQSVIRKNESTLKSFSQFVENITSYTEGSKNKIQQFENQLKSVGGELEKQQFLLQKDINILKRYVGFFYKFKLKLNM